MEELKGLIKKGTFTPIRTEDINGTHRILGSWFVDEIKKSGDHFQRKIRHVAHNYSDEGACQIATKAPTGQRFSQRVALSIAVSMKDKESYTSDVTQVYIQSRIQIERPIYIRSPHELGLEEGKVLHVVLPLYGIPQQRLHWYLTYIEHHLEALGMHRSQTDPCVLIRTSDIGLDGLIHLQFDDTLGLGTQDFFNEEKVTSKEFRSKPRT